MTASTWSRWVVGVMTTALVAIVAPAAQAAYSDVGYDPEDRTGPGDRDIRRSLRRVYPVEGRRALKIKIHTYEDLGWWWWFDVYIDSRGGSRHDYVMQIVNGDMNGNSCGVARRGSDRYQEGRFRQAGTWTSCRVPASKVHPTKRIRWRIVSREISAERPPLDRAPNHGWYP